MRQSKPFCVRNFGNDREYDTVEDLSDGLQSHYRGLSVAVHVKGGRYGMVRPFFIDVGQDGQITETYADRPGSVVDIDTFRQAAQAPSKPTAVA